MTLHVASLFTGVGGIDLAFERAGAPTRLMCEYDKAARSVLARHYPDVPIHHDVRELTHHDLTAAGLRPDTTIVTAGFPCQDLSLAGARRGMGHGTRSGLFWHIIRLLADFRAAWVVLENVPGILSATCPCTGDGACLARGTVRCPGDLHSVTGGACEGGCVPTHGGVMGAVIGALGELGYGLAWRVLDAQHFGVPQRRRRVVIVGRLGDSGTAPAQVLLEPDGCRWDLAEGESEGSDAPDAAARGAGDTVNALTSSQGGPDDNDAQAGHLVVSTFQKVIRSGARDADGSLPPEVWEPRDVAATLSLHDLGSDTRAVELVVCATGNVTHTLTAEGHDAGEDGTGRGTPIIAATLTAGTSSPGVSAPGRRHEDDTNLVVGAVEPEAASFVSSFLATTRYDWTHGERPQAGPGEVLRLLREAVGEEAVAEWLIGVLASLLPAEVLRPEVHGRGLRPTPSEGRSGVDDGTLARPQDGPGRGLRDLRQAGRERRTPPEWGLARQLSIQLDSSLSQLPSNGASRWQAVLDLWRATQRAGLLRQALSEVQEDGRSDQGADADAEAVRCLRGTGALAGALREALHAGQEGGHLAPGLIGGAGVTTVRRLTPLLLECERLQGFPDGWTEGQADSPRYRQMGNAVAVPVFEWVARRLMVEDSLRDRKAAS